MHGIRAFAANRPLVFVILLAVAQPLLAVPFIVAFKLAGQQDIVALRLIVPALQSVFVLWVVWLLGWKTKAGLTTTVRDLHLYWYPALIAFAPVFLYGTKEIAWGWIVFYGAALLCTGISEEGFARGIAIPALMRYGKWVAVFVAAGIFSVGHLTNIFFENFGLLEWLDKASATFGFAILYGAVFLRTGNLWPLVFLHSLHDYSYVTSGTAGPFLVEPMDLRVHLALSLMNAAYGIYILAGTGVDGQSPAESPRPAGMLGG